MTAPVPIIRIPRVEAAPLEIGNDLPLTFICGPCQLESRGHALETAEFLRDVFRRAGAGFIYKTSFDKANRSSLHTKRGAGLATAGPIFEEIRTKLGIPVLTDVHLPDHCADVAQVVDVLQIPAFLCRQTDLLVAAAETGKPINVKKGQFLSPPEMKNVLAKITESGNPQVMACERG
ncbi:MAG: 3-deoxy-8-phosphooctulonate synthase, partial [Caulobacterales bacterium]